jgi:hypothetical protein
MFNPVLPLKTDRRSLNGFDTMEGLASPSAKNLPELNQLGKVKKIVTG